ncbi:hypothetical protein SAMN05421740_1084 [Parapedobacter koreensis]|uniref:Erythromycin esterase n=1 Tax=Parapedobacter koreensis TaxID=332977 RepID=A0A1H7S085_9SPHI|nr:hypothetical protein SAMN05421740_1084 [Parapedobacter koreensis]
MYLIAGVLGIALLVVAYFFISNNAFIGSVDDEFVRYLDQHEMPISGTFDDESTVYLFGENHGFAGNQLADEQLFLSLNKQYGIRYYLAEVDSATAGLLNRFLAAPEQDTLLLKNFVNAYRTRIPQQASRELYDKWSRLHQFNQQLDDSLKISVLGIDKDIDDTVSGIPRDSAMMVNFVNILAAKGLQREKFYGFFGFFHVLQSDPVGMERPFAQRLKAANYPVCSIAGFALDSDMYLPKGLGMPTPDNERVGIANSDGPLILVKGIKDLKAASLPNSTTLFKLNANGSPYLASQKLISIKIIKVGADFMPKSEHETTTDYFQYALLLRNSAALQGLE